MAWARRKVCPRRRARMSVPVPFVTGGPNPLYDRGRRAWKKQAQQQPPCRRDGGREAVRSALPLIGPAEPTPSENNARTPTSRTSGPGFIKGGRKNAKNSLRPSFTKGPAQSLGCVAGRSKHRSYMSLSGGRLCCSDSPMTFFH
jgi:hypothetical protein